MNRKPHEHIVAWGYISAYLPNWKPFKKVCLIV